MQKYLILGGTGFIGSHLCKLLLCDDQTEIYIISRNKPDHTFWLTQDDKFKKVQYLSCDLSNIQKLKQIMFDVKPDKVVFCAGENPSILTKPDTVFIHNNIINAFNLLKISLAYYKSLTDQKKRQFKLLNISTYEIFSQCKTTGLLKIQPKTIYSASKASSFHLFNAWYKTYGLPVTTAICANNYGKNQGADKLIPMTINNLVNKNNIQLFKAGQCKRNWVYVEDTAIALLKLLKSPIVGGVYSIATNDYISNKKLVTIIFQQYSEAKNESIKDLWELIKICPLDSHNAYSHNCGYDKINQELNWQPKTSLIQGLNKTIKFYLN